MQQTQFYSSCQPEPVEGSLSLARPELTKGRRRVRGL